jgi:PPOX class probable F420-dependent enzyme
MTTISSQSHPFVSLTREQYANLTTFRKDDTPVPTPMWFAEHQGIIYIMTGALLGKVKRVRHTPRVTLAPCTARGKVTGSEIAGNARIVSDPHEIELAEAALAKKYGLSRKLLYVLMRVTRALQRKPPLAEAYLAIEA